MTDKKALVLLNGEPPKTLPDLTNYELVCATDGAYEYFKNNNIKVDLVSGDFDSITAIPKETETIHTPDQDFTDFDKMLQLLIDKGFTKVDVFGASGGEQDHFLGNLHTAISYKSNFGITFFDNHQYYFLAKKSEIIQVKKGLIVSLVPFPEAKNITTKGLQYALTNESLKFGERIGTRNIATENKVQIDFTSGELFIFIEKQT